MAAFTPGNVVVYRVGSGATALTANAAEVFLDEYTPTGTLVQTIVLPTSDSGSNNMLTAAGNAGTEGLMTRSVDGRFLVLTGYDAAPGTASVATTTSAAVNRVVGLVGADGLVNTSTALNTFSGGNIRSAATVDGTTFWAAGSNTGVVSGTIGSTSTTIVSNSSTNLRGLEIYDSQLYVSSASGSLRVGTVGTGTPTTSGQTITNLPGFPTTALSPYQFFFADLTAAVAGVDTLYVSDDRAIASGGGVSKYSLVGGSWVSNGTAATGLVSGLRGLTGSTTGTDVRIYGTDAATASHLVTGVDSSGYNAAFSGFSFTTIATAATNTAFRSVAFAPQALAPAGETQTVTFSPASVTHDEGNSGATAYVFTVTRSGGTTGAISFSGTIAAATTDGADYVGGTAPTTFSGTIAAGATSATVTVNVQGDYVVESNESFTLSLTNVSNSDGTVTTTIGAASTATGIVTNDDGAGAISVDDVTLAEGDSGTTAASFTLHRTGGATGTVTVDYVITLPGGAGGADSSDVSATLTGTVTFVEGQTTASIPFSVNGDITNEPNETFTVALSNPTGGATISDASATATITNDDAPPTIAVGDATIVEGNQGVTYLTFTVTLSKPSLDPVTANFATANGTATAGSDYLAVSGALSFAAGETVKTFTVPIVGDTAAEPTETFTVNLSNVAGATVADASGLGTITTDDGAAYYSLASGTFSETWTDTSRISQNDNWSGVPYIIGYLGDYTAASPAGVDPRTLTAASTLGAVDVIANQTNPATQTSGGVAEFQPGATPETTFVTNPVVALQGSGTADAPSLVLFMDASGRSDIRVQALLRDIDTSVDNAVQPIAVQYRTDPNGAWTNAPGGYFSDVSSGPGTTQDTAVDIILPADANDASTLQIRFVTTNATGSDEWIGIDDIQVSSNQSAASYSIADSAVFEGSTGGTTPITFTAPRAVDASAAGTVDYQVSFPGGGFSANAADFTSPLTGTVSFAAGETVKTITLDVVADTVPEGDEAFTVTLSNASNGGILGDEVATGTIVNDDGAPALVTIGDVTQDEGNAGTTSFTFTVTRTGGTGAFTIDYTTSNGSAIAGSDYEAKSGTLSFAPGEASQTITVLVNGDTAGETAETFNVLLSNPVGAVIADDKAVGTIQNDDLLYIHEIQGSSYYSPILAAEGKTGFNTASQTIVIVRAVVTAVDADGPRQGFYITEETSDWDSNNFTSEGIFVMTRNDAGIGTAVSGVAVGDLVTVSAQVVEYQSFNTMPRTMLTNPSSIVVNSTGNALPVLLLDESHPIPNSVMTLVTPDYTDFSDDAGDSFDASLYALSFWETVEGMLVTIPDMVVADGFVSTSGGKPYFQAYSSLHADADQINDRGGYTVAGDPPNSPPDTLDQEDNVIAGGRHLTDGDINPDIIEVDFSGFATASPGTLAQTATMGDKLGDLTGIVEFDFTDRKLFVMNIDAASVTNGVPARETTSLGDDTRALTVATFNVENLDPSDGQARFNALADAIANNLNAPDIIMVEEIQDNNGATNDGTTDASLTWQTLVDALNLATGKHYQWVDEAPVNGAEGGEPGGNIRVGFIYDTARVQLGDLAADATLAERRQYTDRIGDGVRDSGDLIAYSDALIAGEINTGDWSSTRKSLLGQFTFAGNTIFLTANHFTAKGGSGEFWQFDQNIEAGEPANAGWAKRTQQANDVYTMLDYIQTHASDAKIVAGGDLNELYFYRPVEVITGYVTPDGAARSGGSRFDLLTLTLTEAERYSYTFDGRSQALDHMLASDLLGDVVTYDIVHLNTGYNANGTGVDASPRLSDHDPAVASFDFRSFSEIIVGTSGAENLQGMGGNDRIQGLNGADTIDGGDGSDTADYSEDAPYGVVVNLSAEEVTPINQPDAPRDVGPNEALDGFGNYDTLISIENVVTGEKDDIVLGSDGDNRIETRGGNDVIDGGAGADTMIGGAGNDLYIVDSTADVVTELGDEGIDTVITPLSVYVLASNVENLIGVGPAAHDFRGNAEDNRIEGGNLNDTFRLQDGGDDIVIGNGGRDVFYFGAAFDGADAVDGGEGADILILQGDYSAGLTLAFDVNSNITSIESLSLFSGSATSYGDTSGASYRYNITSVDSNVAAGAQLKVNGFGLLAGENLTFDGRAETDGTFLVYAGRGTDTLAGGAGADIFLFGHDGRFAAGDSVDGGGGYDVVYLRGDYELDFTSIGGSETTFANVESIGLLSASDTSYAGGGDGEFDYDIVWSDVMLAAGKTLTINGSRLGANETVAFDGSDELDGAFRLFGGAAADTLEGGDGADLILGGVGADQLTGNGGGDTFRYQFVADSTAGAYDTILDFEHGADLIDVRRIDANVAAEGDQAFAFIGSAAFSGSAGELRAFQVDAVTNLWEVQGDVDGDGNADLVIQAYVEGGQSLTVGDFVV